MSLGIDMHVGLGLEDIIVANAAKKAQNTIDKTFFLSLLAGLWVSFGAIAGLSAAGGIPVAVRNAWPILPRLGLGFFFPFALHFIVVFGGELFTGNMMIMLVGWLNKKVTFKRMLLNWLIVYIGNFAGCVLFGYLFGYLTQSFAQEPWNSLVKSLAVSKTHYSWGVVFLRGIVANTMVNLGIVLGMSSRDAAGKIMALWFPPLLFVLMAGEHVVANQLFINLGLMYGADTSVGLMWKNQSASFLGNLIGGGIVVGAIYHLINHWRSPLAWNEGRHGPGDVESNRSSASSSPSNVKQDLASFDAPPSVSVAPTVYITSPGRDHRIIKLPGTY